MILENPLVTGPVLLSYKQQGLENPCEVDFITPFK